jgi:hypothetical protein
VGTVRHFQIIENYRPDRTVESPVSEAELEQFARDGYLLLPGLIAPEFTVNLADATERILAEESSRAGGGGIFLRHLMDKDQVFLDLLYHPALLPIARLMLGPMVRVLPMTARVAIPGEPNQSVDWHIHQRLVPKPIPPFFSQPVVIDTLIYLDDVDADTGPLQFVPGSHKRTQEPLPTRNGDIEGQVTLMPEAGDAVMLHGNVWHRALATTERGRRRRLLILPFGPAWINLPSFGTRPEGGLLDRLAATADPDLKEVLGECERLY